LYRTSCSGTLTPFCKKSSKGREKRNKFIEKEPRLGALTKRVTRLKRVCNITKTIFDIRNLGNGCKEGKENMGTHTFKDGSSKLTSGKELTTAHLIRI
jgi:hypothetical protein